MKHIAVLLLFLLLFFEGATAQQMAWYKCLKGSIDKFPVTMQLHKIGNSYAGYYYYNSKQEPVYFIGNDTTETGQITLMAFPKSANDDNEVFSFADKDTVFSGKWRKDENSKPLLFSAKPLNDKSLIPFQYIYYYSLKDLKPGMAGSPTVSYEAASIWPTVESSTSSFIEVFARKSFSIEKDSNGLSASFQSMAQQYSDEYMEGYKDITEDELKDRPYSYNSEEIDRLLVVYQSKKILSLSNFTYEYNGGAHGNYSTAYSSLDLINKKEISLKDVISEAGEKQIPRLLEKYFRKAYNVAAGSKLTGEGLFENRIESNDNFCVTGKGIFFSYAPYEIGPYAMGEITIFIPFSELKNYLRPKFKALLQ